MQGLTWNALEVTLASVNRKPPMTQREKSAEEKRIRPQDRGTRRLRAIDDKSSARRRPCPCNCGSGWMAVLD
jgi:hypothetical protein